MLAQMAEAYLGGAPADHPLASPLFADLSGLPPLLIQAGSLEVLHDDAVRVAERARAAGNQVALEVWEDCFHVWHYMAGLVPEGQQAVERVARFVREVTALDTVQPDRVA